jgi:hypothetical protein
MAMARAEPTALPFCCGNGDFLQDDMVRSDLPTAGRIEADRHLLPVRGHIAASDRRSSVSMR